MTAANPSAATSRPLRADARRNRARLLAEARAAVAERGAEASLEEIARRAGVGIGTLYRHFPTRHALMDAVFTDHVEDRHRRAGELLARHAPGDALAAWLTETAAASVAYRGLAEELKACAPTATGEPLRGCRSLMRDATHDLLRRAQRAGDVRADVTAEDLLTFVNGLAWALDGAPDADERMRRLVDVMLDGLRRA